MSENLEFKAKVKNAEEHQRMRSQLTSLGAEPGARSSQQDIVFRVPDEKAGLKLRVQSPGDCQLISWNRPQTKDAKVCRYSVARIEPAEAEAVQRVLTDAIGLHGRVVKERDRLLYRGVIVRFDCVQGIGNFIECEAPLEKFASEQDAKRVLDEIRERLDIGEEMLEHRSYVDLVRASEGTQPS